MGMTIRILKLKQCNIVKHAEQCTTAVKHLWTQMAHNTTGQPLHHIIIETTLSTDSCKTRCTVTVPTKSGITKINTDKQAVQQAPKPVNNMFHASQILSSIRGYQVLPARSWTPKMGSNNPWSICGEWVTIPHSGPRNVSPSSLGGTEDSRAEKESRCWSLPPPTPKSAFGLSYLNELHSCLMSASWNTLFTGFFTGSALTQKNKSDQQEQRDKVQQCTV